MLFYQSACDYGLAMVIEFPINPSFASFAIENGSGNIL